MKEYNKLLLVLCLAFSLFFCYTPTTMAVFDGAKFIFLKIGMDLPDNWGEMTRDERHAYFKNLGIYPSNGDKYGGMTGDLTEYFAKLELEKPDGWDEMKYDERKAYIALSPTLPKQEEVKKEVSEDQVQIALAITPVNNTPDQEKNYNAYIALAVLLFGVLLYLAARFKQINLVVYYFIPAGLAIVSLLSPMRDLFSWYGIIAEALIIFILFVKPIAVIFNLKIIFNAIKFRRHIGVLSFWLFLFHALGFIYIKNLTVQSFYYGNFLFWGGFAGIGMLILAITSNDYSVKLLKKNWCKVQLLVFPVLLATLMHTSLRTYGNLNKFYIIFLVFLVLKILQFSFVKIRK